MEVPSPPGAARSPALLPASSPAWPCTRRYRYLRVLSYAVAQRRREIGVRMALGAQPTQIRRQFLSLGLRLFVAGMILGVVGAWMAGKAMQAVLFNVPTIHLATIAGAAAVMGLVSLVACWLPARRASKFDPLVALRSE